jgi:hypothetical protein
MSRDRAFVASIDISSDGAMTGHAVIQHFAPIGTKVAISGQIKQYGGRRWIELRGEIVERVVSKRLKRSQLLMRET